MIMSDDQSAEQRFAAETANVTDPANEPIVSEIIPPGAGGEEPDSFDLGQFITEEFIAAILSLPGNIMARRTGHEWWKPDQDEADLLGKGGAPAARALLAKYIGEQSGPFAALGMAMGVVYAPKLMREQMERKREKEKPTSRDQRPDSRTSAESPRSSDSEGAENPTSSFDSVEMPDE